MGDKVSLETLVKEMKQGIVCLDDLIYEIETGIQCWIDSHNWDWYWRWNESSIYEDHYFSWLLDNCPHVMALDCDCVVPELDHNDAVSLGKAIYADFCSEFSIDEIMDDMQESLKDIQNADSPEEQIASFVFALHLNHVHGSIVDYCPSIAYETLDSIMQNGLEATIGKRAIDEFIKDW